MISLRLAASASSLLYLMALVFLQHQTMKAISATNGITTIQSKQGIVGAVAKVTAALCLVVIAICTIVRTAVIVLNSGLINIITCASISRTVSWLYGLIDIT